MMDFKKHAWILAVIEGLRKHESWTGKTHVQKTLYLIEAATLSKPPFEFVLYKHGPYSFDAESAIEEMESYGAIAIEPVPGYGVTITPGPMAEYVRAKVQLGTKEQRAMAKVCKFAGSRNVANLERLATAAWIRKKEGRTKDNDVACRLNEIKPHISVEQAKVADQELQVLLRG